MKELRVSIAAITIMLVSIGIVMIYSSSGVYASQRLNNASFYLDRHLLFLCLGFIATLVVMAVDYRVLQRLAKPLMILGLVMLVLVLIPGIGHTSFGARRWFKIGPFSFQPSEFMKIIILIYTADFLSRKQGLIQSFTKGFMPLMIVLGVTCALILKQPDLGNSLLIASIVVLMLFIGGGRIKHLLCVAAMGVPALVYLILSEPYRMRRIVAFLDPWADSQGAGFQLSQSQIALGSGGVFGVGLGQSVQKLFYLPAAHTDFILSIIGEELGLIGTLAVVFLFGAFIWQGARVAKRMTDPFGYFLAIGIVCMLGLQAVVNIGVSMGAFPTKGLPLPFISYGGSALIFNMMAVGLLLNVSRIDNQ